MGLMDMLTQAMRAAVATQQFDQVAQHAPSDVLAKGLSAAFASGSDARDRQHGGAVVRSVEWRTAGRNAQSAHRRAGSRRYERACRRGARQCDVPRTDADHARAGVTTDPTASSGRCESCKRSAPWCRRSARSVLCAAPESHQYAGWHRGHSRHDENERSLVRAIIGLADRLPINDCDLAADNIAQATAARRCGHSCLVREWRPPTRTGPSSLR